MSPKLSASSRYRDGQSLVHSFSAALGRVRQSEEDYVPEGENDPEGRYVSSDDDHSGIVRINNRSRSIVKESKLL